MEEEPAVSIDQEIKALGGSPSVQVERMLVTNDGTALGGVSDVEVRPSIALLLRRSDKLRVVVGTTQLAPANPTTLWFCGWNNPDGCAGGAGTCGPDDLFEPAASGFCQWGGAGRITSSYGTIVLANTIEENQPPGQVLFGEFTDAENAEIYLVLMEHGEVIEELLEEQLTTFLGGCPPNECPEPQGVVFR